jgi:hypothetical protein
MNAIYPHRHHLSAKVRTFIDLLVHHSAEQHIPSFADTKVGVERREVGGKDNDGKPVLDLVPLRRPITVEDLPLQTSGITYGFYGEGLVKAAYDDIYFGDFDNARVGTRHHDGQEDHLRFFREVSRGMGSGCCGHRTQAISW